MKDIQKNKKPNKASQKKKISKQPKEIANQQNNSKENQRQNLKSAKIDRKFYFCPPDYLELKYVINPWMKLDNNFSKEVAKQQWNNLVETYKKIVPKNVFIVPPKPDLTELCFFGDSVFYFKGKAIYGNFLKEERYKETEYVIQYLTKKGIKGKRVPKEINYEGSGETMVWNDKILVGYGQRSGKQIVDFLQKEFPKNKVIGFELIDPEFYHLDTALFPINKNLIAVYENAFSKDAKKIIKNLGCEIIYLSYQDAKQFAFNSIAINNEIIIHYEAVNFIKILKERNFNVHEVDVSEFIKFGGGLKCLTFQMYQ